MIIPVNLKFLRNACQIYGENGLQPATEFSVGVDLRACFDDLNQTETTILPGERAKIGSGIAIEPLPCREQNQMQTAAGAGGVAGTACAGGVAGFVYSRSGLGAKHGLVVAQGVGVIDPDYRGEIIVWLLNTSKNPLTIQQGERMAQLVFLNYFQPAFNIVTELGDTQRGAGGFGHTGR